MSVSTIAGIFILFIGTSFAVNCPTIVTQSDFDISQYTGLWYEIYRIENRFQPGGKCTNATYTPNSDGTVAVFNQEINAQGKYESIQGVAKVKDPKVPAALEVTFGPLQKGSYNVISTNYREYAVVYSCIAIPNTSTKIEFAWILARQKTLSLATVNKCYQFLATLGVSPASLNATPQNC